MRWVYVRAYVCGAWGGWASCSLIPEENVEEINLNYKDEASLESGSGRATEGKESGVGGIYYCCAFLYYGCCCSFFLFFFTHPVGMRWPVFLLPLWLTPLRPLRHPSFTRSLTGFLPISQQCSRCLCGQDWRDSSVLALLPVPSSHRQQMSWFLREHASLCRPLLKRIHTILATSQNS